MFRRLTMRLLGQTLRVHEIHLSAEYRTLDSRRAYDIDIFTSEVGAYPAESDALPTGRLRGKLVLYDVETDNMRKHDQASPLVQVARALAGERSVPRKWWQVRVNANHLDNHTLANALREMAQAITAGDRERRVFEVVTRVELSTMRPDQRNFFIRVCIEDEREQG